MARRGLRRSLLGLLVGFGLLACRLAPGPPAEAAESRATVTAPMAAVAADDRPAEAALPRSMPHLFDPVRVEPSAGPDGATGVEIRVWGRHYHFAKGPLPERIESRSTSLLEAPPGFRVASGGQTGSPQWSAPELVETSAEHVILRSRGSFASLRFDASTRVEYDGMIRVDLAVSARQPATLEHLSYGFDFAAPVARYFNHHVTYDYDSMRVDKTRLLESAGAFPATSRSIAFVPTVFVGNREVGMEWWSETNANWRGARGFRPIRFGLIDGSPRLRVTPIGSPLELPAGEATAWQHTFAIFPAPMRRPSVDWRTTRFTPPGQARKYDHSIGTRFAWIAFPGHFDARWHGLPESIPGTKQWELRTELARDGIAYIPYGKLTAAPSLHPLVLERADVWSATDRLFTGTAAAQRRFLESRGWRPREVFGYAACMARMDYVDWMLEQNLSAFREERPDGLYFDWGAINEPCRRDPRVKDARTDQVFNYFNVRDFYKRLYREVKAIDPDALIAIHTQGQPRALAAHVDYAFMGEALNVLFRGDRSFRRIREDPRLYEPDYFALPPDLLEAQSQPAVGGVAALLPEVKHGLVKGDAKRGRRLTRAFYSIVLVNDMPVWLTNTDPDVQVEIFRAVDRFGGLGGVEVHPWWSNRESFRRDDALRVTAYVREGRALLVLANWSDGPLRSSVEIDLPAVGLDPATSLSDAESRRVVAMAEPGRFPVEIPSRDFRLLILE